MKFQKTIDKIMKKKKNDDVEKVITFSIVGALVGMLSAFIFLGIKKKDSKGLLKSKFFKGILKNEKIQDIKSNLKKVEKELLKTKEALLDI